jgi:hypothetical protein
MAMALPAELNRYPGPLHVLEHAAALDLTPEQKDQLTHQVETMRTAAVALGEQIIARESELDAHFRSGAADADTIDRITSEITALYGQLRAVHLRTHLATRASLTEVQLAKYQTLRGYDANGVNPVHKLRRQVAPSQASAPTTSASTPVSMVGCRTGANCGL